MAAGRRGRRFAARRHADSDARRRRPPTARPSCRGDAPAVSGRRCPATRSSSTDRSGRDRIRHTAQYLERIGAVGTLTSRTLEVEPAPDRPRSAARGTAARRRARRSRRVLPEPEAGLAAGILIGLRDRVDRDLAAAFTTAGVSHVVAISGWNIAIVAAAIAAMAGRLGRRRRSVVTILAIVAYVAFAGRIGVGRPGRADGRRRPARARDAAARVGPRPPSAGRRRSCCSPTRHSIGDAGLPALVARDGRADRLGDAARPRWIESPGAAACPRWLAESLGVSLAAQAATLPIILVVVRSARGPVAGRQPRRRPARGPGDGRRRRRAGRRARGQLAGAPPIVGACSAAPGWVILRILVAIVEAAAGLPFASVTLTPPFDVVAAVVAAAAIAGAHLVACADGADAVAPPPARRRSPAPPAAAPGRAPAAATGRSRDAAAAIAAPRRRRRGRRRRRRCRGRPASLA